MSTVNPKVTAAGFTAALTGLILYCLDQIAFVAAMDEVTKGFVYVIVLGAVTFAAGYLKSNSGGEHRA